MLQSYTKFVNTFDREAFEFLCDSSARLKLLQILRSVDQPISPAALTEQVSEASSTVWRCLDSLKEYGWVHQPGKYRYLLTETGARIIDVYERMAASIEWITEHATIVNHLDPIGTDLPVTALASGNTRIVRTSQADREAVLNHYADYLLDPLPVRIRGISPIASTLLNDMHRPLLDEKIEIELVVDELVMDIACSSYSEALRAADQTETLRLFLHPDRLEFGLAVLDFEQHTRNFLFVYDGRGDLRACIDSTAGDVTEWATALYEDYRDTAQSLSDTELSTFA